MIGEKLNLSKIGILCTNNLNSQKIILYKMMLAKLVNLRWTNLRSVESPFAL